MKILNWNLNSLKNKLPELQILIAQNAPDIILLQEIRLKPSQPFNLKNYNLFRKDFTGGLITRGSVLAAVHNNIHSSHLTLQTNLQAIAVSITSPIKITFCSIYLHQDDVISDITLNDLTK